MITSIWSPHKFYEWLFTVGLFSGSHMFISCRFSSIVYLYCLMEHKYMTWGPCLLWTTSVMVPSSGLFTYKKLVNWANVFSAQFSALYTVHSCTTGSLIMPISRVFKEKWTKCGNEPYTNVTLWFLHAFSNKTVPGCF